MGVNLTSFNLVVYTSPLSFQVRSFWLGKKNAYYFRIIWWEYQYFVIVEIIMCFSWTALIQGHQSFEDMYYYPGRNPVFRWECNTTKHRRNCLSFAIHFCIHLLQEQVVHWQNKRWVSVDITLDYELQEKRFFSIKNNTIIGKMRMLLQLLLFFIIIKTHNRLRDGFVHGKRRIGAYGRKGRCLNVISSKRRGCSKNFKKPFNILSPSPSLT